MSAPAGTITIRVRYHECDPMGVAHHAVYPVWLEMGRTELLRQMFERQSNAGEKAGLTYRHLEEQGIFLAVVSLGIKYKRPARYDDLLEIRTRVSLHSGARVSFEYEVHTAGHASALATGFTAHAAIDRRGKPRRLPAELRRLLS